MNRKKSSIPQESPTTAKPEEPANHVRVIREFVEALATALVLAFFFKAFVAELFIIPTGSMATTLMGRHKDVHCEQCGFPFQISASEESNDGSEHPRNARELPSVLAGTCPQCRYTMYVGKNNVDNKVFQSFNGDRIFVNKCQFDFRNPTRWHVTVFRYPGKPQVNYIKRLVGVENETVILRNGDVFVKKDGETEFTIQRKPLRALLAMLRPVDDNDYVLPKLHELGLPARWFDEKGNWNRSNDYKSFQITKNAAENATVITSENTTVNISENTSENPSENTLKDVIENSSTEPIWLNYRHIVPSSDEWFYLSQEKLPPQGMVNNPQLVTDFVGYNSGIVYSPDHPIMFDSGLNISTREVQRNGKSRKEFFCRKNLSGMGLNWVGDLAVSCRLHIENPEGSFLFRLVKGGVVFLCSIDLHSGNATLSIPELPEFSPAVAPTPLRCSGTFDLMFCNCDEELRLIVNGKEINFQEKGRYDFLCQSGSLLARDRSPTRLDLTPAGIGAQNAAVRVEHLKVLRDLYYIACDRLLGLQCDLLDPPFHDEYSLTENSINRIFSRPEYWRNFGKTNTVSFKLGKDQFLMLGDNSTRSSDGRLWRENDQPLYVDRNLLIGEAVFVYWPHGLRIPGTRIALIPNLQKLRFID
ncbi:MAG: S26 family signal peptidase [Planctomycetaceae bacterium]|jgi:signal peptidase I|nr:S26 family signal peptidase [Planctomycetaceae bacterium]